MPRIMSFGGALHGRVGASSRFRRQLDKRSSAPSVSTVGSGTSSPTTWAERRESFSSRTQSLARLPSFVQVGGSSTGGAQEDTWGQFVDTAEADIEIVRSSKILSARQKSFEEDLCNWVIPCYMIYVYVFLNQEYRLPRLSCRFSFQAMLCTHVSTIEMLSLLSFCMLLIVAVN